VFTVEERSRQKKTTDSGKGRGRGLACYWGSQRAPRKNPIPGKMLGKAKVEKLVGVSRDRLEKK